MKAFIVEDSPIILDRLVATLEELAPVQVVGSARDEAGAMQWLRERGQGCDLVIVDLFLREGSGLGVLRGAQALRLTARRLVLTNYATPDMREACTTLGADRVFDKSGELEDLLAYCEQLAAGGEAPGEAAGG